MFADAETCSESLEHSWRRLRAAGLAVVLAAGLLAAGLAGASSASASAATMVTQSAKGGVLKNGRLTLRGVSGRVTYVLNTGRQGTLSVRRLHRRLFLPGEPATGTLHVAGFRRVSDFLCGRTGWSCQGSRSSKWILNAASAAVQL